MKLFSRVHSIIVDAMDEEIHNPESLDDYEAAINLSNSCREFYHHRVKATAEFKQLVKGHTQRQPGQYRGGTKKTSLDRAMERLKNEMAELMDQDLSLMEQLLTLNERIAEVKTQFMYNSSCETMYDSTHNLSDSEQSLSRTTEDVIDLPSVHNVTKSNKNLSSPRNSRKLDDAILNGNDDKCDDII